MTFNEMRRKCLQKYIELWGEEWVEQRKSSIWDGYTDEDENGELRYSICQHDKKQNPGICFSHTLPRHYTNFKCNMKTGEIEVIDHR